MTVKPIRWLHLSDFHTGKEDYPQGEIFSEILKEIGKRAAEQAEEEFIGRTLEETRWNRKEAAMLLRISYKALLYKIQKYQLDESRSRGKTGKEMRSF